MSRSESPKPQVSATDRRSFVTVPTGRSADLHAYLREHHVRCDPPDPCSTDLDVIELDRGVDVGRVRELLNGWA